MMLKLISKHLERSTKNIKDMAKIESEKIRRERAFWMLHRKVYFMKIELGMKL